LFIKKHPAKLQAAKTSAYRQVTCKLKSFSIIQIKELLVNIFQKIIEIFRKRGRKAEFLSEKSKIQILGMKKLPLDSGGLFLGF